MGGDGLKQKAFELFEQMKPGDGIVIREFARKDPKKFVEYCKQWINLHPNYEFNKDYSIFRKMLVSCGRLDWK